MARARAAVGGIPLWQVIENSLRAYLPKEMKVELTGDPGEMKLEFISGPTISQGKPSR